ncbi:MAG: (d)CMP kinase [Verrucomicrobiota bacterium]
MSTHLVIAIDGPAASGKSSVAKVLARRLGYVYVNTGAMYRAVTWHVLASGVSPSDQDAVLALMASTKMDCDVAGHESSILINGVDPTPNLVSEGVNGAVSAVATIPEVRRQLVALQRAYGDKTNSVMEGRDIGSAVFPETPYKFYIDASPEVRAQRRAKQGLQDSILQRDKVDSTRKMSPLVIAEDAHVIDSSHLTVDGVVGEIIGRLKIKGLLAADF